MEDVVCTEFGAILDDYADLAQMFDARVPDRVKVLEHFAERRSGPDGALYARPGLRLATQQDLDAVLFSEKDWRRQFMWAGRNTAPTIRIYSFEGLPPSDLLCRLLLTSLRTTASSIPFLALCSGHIFS